MMYLPRLWLINFGLVSCLFILGFMRFKRTHNNEEQNVPSLTETEQNVLPLPEEEEQNAKPLPKEEEQDVQFHRRMNSKMF